MNVLMVSAFHWLGGDVKMYVLGLPALESVDDIEVHVAAAPRGSSTEYLRSLPHITMHEMELGGSETSARGRAGRAFETLTALARLVAVVRRHDIDVVYTLDRGVSMRLAYAVARITRRPLLYNMQIAHYLDTSPMWRRVIGHAASLSVSSTWMKEAVAPHVSADATVHVIPNAIHVADYDHTIEAPEIREELNIADDAIVVSLAGRLTRYKGQEDLLHAVHSIRNRYRNIHVLLIGGPDAVGVADGYEDTLRQLCAELEMSERVHFLGWRDDVDRIYAASDIVTMPSHEEAFGLVAAEGMAMERPVIATAAGGVPEFISDRDNGHLVPPQDPEALAERLLEVLDNPAEARELALRARKSAEENLDVAIYSDRMLRLWRTLA